MTLNVRVENGASPIEGPLVPVLAHATARGLSFRAVEVRGEFPATFELDVYESPRDATLAPIDPAQAAHSRVSIEYLAAVPKTRIDEPIDLSPAAAMQRDCWNGSCDLLPGRTSAVQRCDVGQGATCGSTSTACQGEACTLVHPAGVELPSSLLEIVGFARDHAVLYVADPLAPQSWTALRLGAPEGLAAGYHLVALLAPESEASEQASASCVAAAETEALERFNAAHASAYDQHTLECLQEPADPACADAAANDELPSGAQAHALGAAFAAAEIAHGCLTLNPDIAPVPAPLREPITIRIGDTLPAWRPSHVATAPREAP